MALSGSSPSGFSASMVAADDKLYITDEAGDVHVVRTGMHFEVLATNGDTFLGGDDVDRTIALHVADRTLSSSGWDLTNDAVTFDRLVHAREQVERTVAVQITDGDRAEGVRPGGRLGAGSPWVGREHG